MLKANFAYNLHEVATLPNSLCSLICHYIITYAVFLPQDLVKFDVMTSIFLMSNHIYPKEFVRGRIQLELFFFFLALHPPLWGCILQPSSGL